MCEVCNRAGMVPPAATQMHGTVAVAIIGSVIGLGVVASLLVGGVGPFPADVVSVGPLTAGAVSVSLEVVNEGTRAGRARCELTAIESSGTPLGRVVAVSPEIAPGDRLPFDAEISGLTAVPDRVIARCQ